MSAYILLETGSHLLLESLADKLLLEGTGGIPPLYLPYEYISVPIDTGNINPFGIDPEQTTLVTAGNVNPFGIDPERTTLITVGLTAAD